MSSKRCPNCKSAITCSCQLRTSSDGKAVCSKCITAYESNLKNTGAIITSASVIPNFPK